MATSSGTPVGNCPRCNATITDQYSNSWCPKCGESLPPDITARLRHLQAILTAPRAAASTATTQRQSYPALRMLSSVYRVTAYVVLGIGVLLFIGAIQTNNLLVVVGVALYVAFVFLLLLAGAEFLRIVPDIADQTKATTDLLRDIKTSLSNKI